MRQPRKGEYDVKRERLLATVRADPEVTEKALRERFGVSRSVIHTWLLEAGLLAAQRREVRHG